MLAYIAAAGTVAQRWSARRWKTLQVPPLNEQLAIFPVDARHFSQNKHQRVGAVASVAPLG
jgi:hypothetical protein